MSPDILDAVIVPVTVADETSRLVAVIAPLIVAPVAVKAPAAVTLNGASKNVSDPSCTPVELTLKNDDPEPTSKATSEIVVPVDRPRSAALRRPGVYVCVYVCCGILCVYACATESPNAKLWRLCEPWSNVCMHLHAHSHAFMHACLRSQTIHVHVPPCVLVFLCARALSLCVRVRACACVRAFGEHVRAHLRRAIYYNSSGRCFHLPIFPRSLMTRAHPSATSHHKTAQYQKSINHMNSAHPENAAPPDAASRARVEYAPADTGDAGRGARSRAGRPSSAVLAHSLAASSMAFLETHQHLGANAVGQEAEGNRGEGGGGGSALFQNDFLNKNPILMEYMAQAALEGLDSEDDAAGPARERWEAEEETEEEAEEDGGAAEDHIKFIDVLPKQGDKDAVGSERAAGDNSKPGVAVAVLPVRGIAGVRSSSKVANHDGREERALRDCVEEEEACLSRSETSRRPGSRARRCGSFASNLRQVASTMTGQYSILLSYPYSMLLSYPQSILLACP